METRYFVGNRDGYKQLYVFVEFTKIWKRVISVLLWFSKLLEKFMYKRGIKFLDKHNIISESLEAIEDKEYAMDTFLNLSKAFDTVKR